MSVGNLLTIDGHHLRLTRLVDFLASGLLRSFLYGLIPFLGLSLYLSLVDLGLLHLGLLLFCFLFHSICLSLVCCLFLTHL